MATSKTMQERFSKNYKITSDALKVIEAFKKLDPQNERKVSEFVDEAILHYGAVVLGNKMPKLSEEASSGAASSFAKIQKELDRLRLRIIDVEYEEDKQGEMIELLTELNITSKKSFMKSKWKEHKKQLSKYLTHHKDWKSFIEKNEEALIPE